MGGEVWGDRTASGKEYITCVRAATLQKCGVKFFSVSLCRRCCEIWRVIFQVLRFPGFGCPNRKTQNFMPKTATSIKIAYLGFEPKLGNLG